MVKPTIKVIQNPPTRFGSFVKRLTELSRKQVLVGIPAENSTRADGGDRINNAELLYILSHGVRQRSMRVEMQKNIDSGMKYSAAHSLYIQSHGSPLWQIPPRPVLEPAIEAHKAEIAEKLKLACKDALKGNTQSMNVHLREAGFKAEKAAKGWFEDPRNKWPPNAPETIRRKGSDLPMVDTNEMRKSITHVIREV